MLTYKDAGVDKEAGYREVALIKDIIRSTRNAGSVSEIGGFAGLYRPDFAGMEDPLLVSGTDGVGTKLQLAYMMDRHDTIGQDCVAMCVNDILCQGAEPLFFLDYIATGELIPEKMAAVVKGIADGCIQSGCALIGGETAEMPGIYQKEHYDLAGFAVGIVDRPRLITGESIGEGDVVLGLRSSGVHSNGFSLVRKIIFEVRQFDLGMDVPEFGTTLGEELLKPTRIYADVIGKLLQAFTVRGLCHVTGGGLYENLPRILPEGLGARLEMAGYKIPVVFNKLQEWGGVETEEMFHTFNMGIGMCIVVAAEDAEAVTAFLVEAGEDPLRLGTIVSLQTEADSANSTDGAAAEIAEAAETQPERVELCGLNELRS